MFLNTPRIAIEKELGPAVADPLDRAVTSRLGLFLRPLVIPVAVLSSVVHRPPLV